MNPTRLDPSNVMTQLESAGTSNGSNAADPPPLGTEDHAVPEVVAPPPGNPRFELLDGLRAIAALSVVALHVSVQANYFPGLEWAYGVQFAAGVTIFFLLSGFLLYRPFVHARYTGRSPVRVRDYARRRLLRIIPAYWLALTVLSLWPGLGGAPLSSGGWRYYGFLQTFNNGTIFNGIGTAWSLGTEVSFYLVLPFLAIAFSRLTRGGLSRRAMLVRELAVLATLAAASFLFRAVLYSKYPNYGYTLFGTFDWFAIGMALAVLSVAAEQSGASPFILRLIWRRPSLCWVGAFGALTIGALYIRETGKINGYSAGPVHYIWALMALLLLLPAAFPNGRHGVPRRILSRRPVAWLGLVSYGIYLWHLPLMPKIAQWISDVSGKRLAPGGHPAGVLMTVVLYIAVLAVSTACAAASYYLVERPLLRFKNGFRSVRPHIRWLPGFTLRGGVPEESLNPERP